MSFPRLLSINEWRKQHSVQDEVAKTIEQHLDAIYSAKTFYERFDCLIALHDYTHSRLEKDCIELNETVNRIFRHILDINNAAVVISKLNARKVVREFDPHYIPWHRPIISPKFKNDPYQLYLDLRSQSLDDNQIKTRFQIEKQEMHEDGELLEVDYMQALEDDKHPIHYHSKEEIEEFRVIPHKGKLIKMCVDGKKEDRHLTFDYFDSSKLTIKSVNDYNETETHKDKGIYVIAVNGSIFVGPAIHPELVGVLSNFLFDSKAFIHPSYQPHDDMKPFMAGQIGYVRRGVVHLIDSGSGHYKPNKKQSQRSAGFLERIGIMHNNTRREVYHPVTGEFLPLEKTPIEFEITSYFLSNKIKSHEVSYELIKKRNPRLYNRIVSQHAINIMHSDWMITSRVFGSTPSVHTLRLNEAFQVFSNYATIDNIDTSIVLLQVCLDAITAWKNYHQTTGLKSRREGAVFTFENRLMEIMAEFKLRQVLIAANVENVFVQDFLQYKISREEFTTSLNKFTGSIGLFAQNKDYNDQDKIFLSQINKWCSLSSEQQIQAFDSYFIDSINGPEVPVIKTSQPFLEINGRLRTN